MDINSSSSLRFHRKMCDDMQDVRFCLTVMVNQEENRVFYAVADCHFVDILLSFLTLPLGRILKVLEKHFGDEAPTFGSLSSLYHGLANLDTSRFVTEGAKNTLLHAKHSNLTSLIPLLLNFLIAASAPIMDLLKASFTSPTPLSDIILNKTTQMKYSAIRVSQPTRPNSLNYKLKAVIQSSTGKLLYAQVEKDLIEFLFSLLQIPLGKVEHLMSGKTCFKAIDNLYRSIDDSITNISMRNRLKEPNLAHGCISENHILPLTQESLPYDYTARLSGFYSGKFPRGQGSYLSGSQTCKVEDDLTVTPYCPVSILLYLKENKILLTDIKEVELKVGFNEGLSILAASLTSTTALTDVLLNQKLNKQPKTEV